MPHGMSTQTLTMRPIQLESDLDQVLALFTLVFGTEESPEKWRWKYCPPWAEHPHAWLATEGKEIVAHVGAVPVRGVLNREDVMYFQIVDAMFHPEYRGRQDPSGAGLRLFEEILEERPASVLYGFTGRRPYLWYRRKRISDMVEEACDVILRASHVTRPLRPDLDIEEWSWTAPELESIWETRRVDIRAGLIRDGRYLGWRYGAHPTDRFRLLGVLKDGKPAGWAVVAEARNGEEVRVNDILVPRDLLRPAVEHVMDFLDAGAVVQWLPSWLRPAFQETRDVGMLAHHVVWKNTIPTEYLRNHLYYTLGDVDGW
jgi:hypothetical protein